MSTQQQTNRVQLGAQVRDVVTNWEGIATCRMEYLDGSSFIYVTPQTDTEGRLRKARLFSEALLQTIGQGINLPENTVTHRGQQYQPTASQ